MWPIRAGRGFSAGSVGVSNPCGAGDPMCAKSKSFRRNASRSSQPISSVPSAAHASPNEPAPRQQAPLTRHRAPLMRQQGPLRRQQSRAPSAENDIHASSSSVAAMPPNTASPRIWGAAIGKPPLGQSPPSTPTTLCRLPIPPSTPYRSLSPTSPTFHPYHHCCSDCTAFSFCADPYHSRRLFAILSADVSSRCHFGVFSRHSNKTQDPWRISFAVCPLPGTLSLLLRHNGPSRRPPSATRPISLQGPTSLPEARLRSRSHFTLPPRQKQVYRAAVSPSILPALDDPTTTSRLFQHHPKKQVYRAGTCLPAQVYRAAESPSILPALPGSYLPRLRETSAALTETRHLRTERSSHLSARIRTIPYRTALDGAPYGSSHSRTPKPRASFNSGRTRSSINQVPPRGEC